MTDTTPLSIWLSASGALAQLAWLATHGWRYHRFVPKQAFFKPEGLCAHSENKHSGTLHRHNLRV